MTESVDESPDSRNRRFRIPSWDETRRQGSALGIAVLILAGFTLLTPLLRADVSGRIGVLLVLAALLEVAHGFRRSTADGQLAAWTGGGITLAMGVLLINAPYFAGSALILILAGWFGVDGIRCLLGGVRRGDLSQTTLLWLLPGLGNLLVAGMILLFPGPTVAWTVTITAAVRMLGTASNIFLASVFTAVDSGDIAVVSLDLVDHPELQTLARRISDEETARSRIDRGWIIGFIATLFAIHLGRMGLDRSFLGILSPIIAVLGDISFALILAFAIVIPIRVTWDRLTYRLVRQGWLWYLAVPAEGRRWSQKIVQSVLVRRLRRSIRMQQSLLSFRTALSHGLQIGLPLAAMIAATVPVWGMSWYFDTENWAAGVWNSWAEERTDLWREAMVRAVQDQKHIDDPGRVFAVSPPGVESDFSFLVIGDTGEGDASQHSLRAEFLAEVRRDDVKFVVISSDVVYPTGAMKDYEANFWLPFMGTTKPVYAIPGNHDWYDALEAFVATFFEPNAARAALRARVAADGGITSTTDAVIEELIAGASRLRSEYGVPTQLQSAPFFQFQTDTFALFAVDTGVAKRIDSLQLAWLKEALGSARGKTKMAILGHPLFAGGSYQAADNPDFSALHELLREHDVAIVMGGDTHDLEYYVEASKDARQPMLHFVNGGGGAYLSFGTSLSWPEHPATEEWAFYPRKAQVVSKIEASLPRWKRPVWSWTLRWNAWPFSSEWLSAAFDSNLAPFLQSFVEVRVEPSKSQIRLIPHGVHGPLRWSDLEVSPGRPAGSELADSTVEWVVPIRRPE